MRKFFLLCAVTLAALLPTKGFCLIATDASLKEARLVTDVLPWGETVMAVRLEYSDELFCGELNSLATTVASDTSLSKFHLLADRSVVTTYVNNSGKRGDVALYGKYVFIELGVKNPDPTTYRTQVTFDTAKKTRDRLPAYSVAQTAAITTRSGQVIAPATISTTGEIALGIDDYTTSVYKNDATGHSLTYHLFIPKGYESKRAGLKNLPLVVHFPAGDYSYVEWNGKYRGALFSHHDALYWSDEESQAKHPAFVVTVGGPTDPTWASGPYEKSDMQQNYIKIIQKLMADFNVDTSRVYAVSLAGGSPPMWNTILANPTLFAGQISTSYDPYHAYKSATAGEEKFDALLKTLPGWFFAGMKDTTGYGVLGAADTRYKGERLRDIAGLANQHGFKVNVAYGKEGELMWNGLLRGPRASALATDQLARAKAHADTSLVTVYMPGTILLSQHWVWDATYSNAAVRDWLFQQVRHAPHGSAK